MALNQSDRDRIVKEAEKAAKERRENEIKFSASGGSVTVNGTKYTDAHYAVNRINGGNK